MIEHRKSFQLGQRGAPRMPLLKFEEEQAFGLADSSCWGPEQGCRKLAVNSSTQLAWPCFEASDEVF